MRRSVSEVTVESKNALIFGASELRNLAGAKDGVEKARKIEFKRSGRKVTTSTRKGGSNSDKSNSLIVIERKW